jgi:hypothetical protein
LVAPYAAAHTSKNTNLTKEENQMGFFDDFLLSDHDRGERDGAAAAHESPTGAALHADFLDIIPGPPEYSEGFRNGVDSVLRSS